MAHRTFFSFHYERDVWRASNVRNSSRLLTSVDPEWIDASLWEETKKQSDLAVKRLINKALERTTVTCVLIGSQTASRRWVKYEIEASLERGNGIFGIYIHNIRDSNGNTDGKGANPLPAGYKTYDWVNGKGRDKLGAWVDKAHDDR